MLNSKDINNKKTLNYVNLLQTDPIELATYLQNQYISPIPVNLNDVEDLKKAGILLGQLTNAYAYLNSMATFAKLKVKEEKRKKSEKSIIDDAISRRDIIENCADSIKMQYMAISRMITVKKQVDDEMRMV